MAKGYFQRGKDIIDDSKSGTNTTYSSSKIDGLAGGSTKNPVTANTPAGNIASGDVVPAGTTLEGFIKQLLVKEIAPSTQFTISKDGNQLYGNSYTETLTLKVTALNSASSVDSIDWYEGSTLLHSDTISSTGTYTYTLSNATTDTTTFKAVLHYKKSDSTTATIQNTKTITFRYPFYYGSVSSATPTASDIQALIKGTASAKGNTLTFNLSASRSCYCYPASLGNISSIKDANNFEYIGSYTKTTINLTVPGASGTTTVSYNLYVLTDAVSATGFKQIYS